MSSKIGTFLTENHIRLPIVAGISTSLMSGILMDELDGWQELLPIHGTPLMHTGRGDELSEAEVLIYGTEEQAAGEITVRDMGSGEQTRVPFKEAAAHIRARLSDQAGSRP